VIFNWLTLVSVEATLSARFLDHDLGFSLSELSPNTVSELLANWHAGDDEALRAALPLVYEELRRVARHYLRQERPGHTLQGTALVHEAYLRLEKQGATDFKNVNIFWRSALNYAANSGRARTQPGCGKTRWRIQAGTG